MQIAHEYATGNARHTKQQTAVYISMYICTDGQVWDIESVCLSCVKQCWIVHSELNLHTDNVQFMEFRNSMLANYSQTASLTTYVLRYLKT